MLFTLFASLQHLFVCFLCFFLSILSLSPPKPHLSRISPVQQRPVLLTPRECCVVCGRIVPILWHPYRPSVLPCRKHTLLGYGGTTEDVFGDGRRRRDGQPSGVQQRWLVIGLGGPPPRTPAHAPLRDRQNHGENRSRQQNPCGARQNSIHHR